MQWGDVLNLVGAAVSIVSVVVAVVQTFRKREVEQTLAELRRARRADTWTNLAIVVKTFDTLDEARDELLKAESSAPVVLSKVSSARRGTIDHWRHLLKQAVLEEACFTQKTIDRWIADGKLENAWRVRQARRLLDESPSE